MTSAATKTIVIASSPASSGVSSGAMWARSSSTPGTLEVFYGPGRLDGGLAEGADLPERLERGAAPPARFFQLRRADRAGEKLRLDDGPADRAAVGLPERVFHRLDLELALPHVLE